MNCIIVEDNEIAVILLKEFIEQHGNLKLNAVFDNGEKALNYLQKNTCDLLFLDIELKGINGIDLIKQLKNTPNIVITSSKRNYAADAFDFDVADYLVKPFSYERFQKAITKVSKIQDSLQPANTDFFYIKQNGKMLQVPFKDVDYIEAMSDYVNIYTPKERFVIYSTMKAMENQFPSGNFVRVHRSFIVCVSKIKEIKKNVLFINEKEIPISRTHKDELMKKVKLF